MKKRVLLIAYYFPPIQSSGTLRSLKFAELLPEYGWEPIVLTVRNPQEKWVSLSAPLPDEIKIHRSSELPFRKFLDLVDYPLSKIIKLLGGKGKLNYAYEYLGIPDEFFGWFFLPKALKLANECNVVYVSCSPFSAALSAIAVSKLKSKPLVIDFRDCWSNWVGERSKFKLKTSRLFESFYLKHCDAFIANTPSAGEFYKSSFPRYSNKIHVITNGFDTTNVPKNISSEPFRILHIGTFYGERKPDLLLQALYELELPNVEFVQVGGSVHCSDEVRKRVKVVECKSVPHTEALELMKTASLLYLKQAWSLPGRKNLAVAQKTYEYLATGLPILAECSPGDNLDIIKRNCANPYLVSEDCLNTMKAELQKAYKNKSNLEPQLTNQAITNFSRSNLTHKLSEVFESV